MLLKVALASTAETRISVITLLHTIIFSKFTEKWEKSQEGKTLLLSIFKKILTVDEKSSFRVCKSFFTKVELILKINEQYYF